ncbi:MAG: hypothetical protein ACXWVJ_02970 [Caulobacteraceae bacterium]
MKTLAFGVAALGLLTADIAAAQTVHTNRQGETVVKHRQKDGDVVKRTYERDGDRVRTVNGRVTGVNKAGPGRYYTYGGRRYTAVRAPRWNAPRNWSYRRYAIGAYLPGFFLSSSYYVNPYTFGIRVGPAGYGRRWVRVGDDLYLVNGRGRVFQVIHGAFYY